MLSQRGKTRRGIGVLLVAVLIGILYAVEGEKHTVRTASGFAVGYGVLLDEVKIRSLGIKRVTGTVIDGDFPGVPLLGQSFPNRLDIHREGTVMELRER